MALESTQRVLIEFIESKLVLDREPPTVAPDEPLIGSILDSLNLLRLVVFIEERFGFHVDDGDLVPDNFETVEKITTYIQTKTATSKERP